MANAGELGNFNATNRNWIDSGTLQKHTGLEKPLYALSETLTVGGTQGQTVPEPCTLISSLGLVALAWYKRRRT